MSAQHSENKLAIALKTASDELSVQVLEDFYQVLLASCVFVPRLLGREDEIGENTSGCLQRVWTEQKIVVPIFSSPDYATDWLRDGLVLERIEFAELLGQLEANDWLHLDPNRPCGKEVSPFEIAILKNGLVCIDELLDELGGELLDYDVRSNGRRSFMLEQEACADAFTNCKYKSPGLISRLVAYLRQIQFVRMAFCYMSEDAPLLRIDILISPDRNLGCNEVEFGNLALSIEELCRSHVSELSPSNKEEAELFDLINAGKFLVNIVNENQDGGRVYEVVLPFLVNF